MGWYLMFETIQKKEYVPLSIRVSKEEKEIICKLAVLRNVSISNAVRLLIKAGVAAYGLGKE
jgi:hypothetical protein